MLEGGQRLEQGVSLGLFYLNIVEGETDLRDHGGTLPDSFPVWVITKY